MQWHRPQRRIPQLVQQGLAFEWKDDEANYEERMKAIIKGE